MIAFGWTEDHLHMAAIHASELYEAEGGVTFEVRDSYVQSYRCRKGNHTIKFTLGIATETRRRKDGTYPPGVARTEQMRVYDVRDIIPLPELGDAPYYVSGYNRGHRRRETMFEASTGSPCWHAFGHFFRRLFEVNPNGKIHTGLNTYDGVGNFNTIAPRNKQAQRQICDCHELNLWKF